MALPLKREFGTNGFSGSEADLVVNGNERAGSIAEHSATTTQEVILRVTATRMFFAFNAGDTLVRENALTRKELFTFQSTFVDLRLVCVACPQQCRPGKEDRRIGWKDQQR